MSQSQHKPAEEGQPRHPETPPPLQTWPTVIGVLSIVHGACVGLVIAMGTIGAVARLGQPAPDPASARIAGRLCAICSVWLLSAQGIVAGIQALRRRPSARSAHLAYGLLGLLPACGYVFALTAMGRAGSLSAFLVIVIVAAFLLISAYPLFALVWFLRPTIRRQVQEWDRPAWVEADGFGPADELPPPS